MVGRDGMQALSGWHDSRGEEYFVKMVVGRNGGNHQARLSIMIWRSFLNPMVRILVRTPFRSPSQSVRLAIACSARFASASRSKVSGMQ